MQIGNVTQNQVDNLNYDCTMVGSFQPHITGLPKTGYGIIVLYPYIDKTKQNGAQEVFYTDGERYWRKAVNDSVSPWYPVAAATPPQEYDLPLADGIGSSAKYSKDQFGRVQLRGWITGATDNSVLATLPAGFRPASRAHFIQAIYSASQCGIARVAIETDGTIFVEKIQDGTLANGLSLQLSFLAAS